MRREGKGNDRSGVFLRVVVLFFLVIRDIVSFSMGF